MFDIAHYLTSQGTDTFEDWFKTLRDTIAKVRIARRLDRLSLGNLGDYKPVGCGVWELRIDHGPWIPRLLRFSGQRIGFIIGRWR